MSFLSRSLAQIKAQLQGLTMSQRLLLGLLVVMLIGTIFFVVEFSRKPEMVELLPQSAKPEEISNMVSYLKINKYTYEVQGDKILVPVEQAYGNPRGICGARRHLTPENTTAAFSALAAANDFMLSDASVERRWNVGDTGGFGGQTIRHFLYIAMATVVIARGQPDGIGLGHRCRRRHPFGLSLKGRTRLQTRRWRRLWILWPGRCRGSKKKIFN